MDETSKEFLKRLLSCVGPSGFEDEPGRVWREEAGKFGAETWTDAHGNSFARLNKGGTPRVLLAGHLDEIGFMVTHIDDKGYVFFQPIGGWDSQVAVGQRVWVRSSGGRRVLGVIGKKPIHLMKQEERDKVSKIEDLWIDIGTSNRTDAEALVEIGDPIVLAWEPQELRNGLIVSRGLDNRSGAFVVLEALRYMSSMQALNAEVVAVGTSQEEIGMRGACTASYSVEPKIGIAVDVTFATDHPAMDDEKKKIGHVVLGGGPVLSRGANINPVLFDHLREAARRGAIPHQIEPAPRGTSTDAHAIQLSRGGVATALISVPNRYMHSPCEMCSLNDLDNAALLIAQAVTKLDPDADMLVR